MVRRVQVKEHTRKLPSGRTTGVKTHMRKVPGKGIRTSSKYFNMLLVLEDWERNAVRNAVNMIPEIVPGNIKEIKTNYGLQYYESDGFVDEEVIRIILNDGREFYIIHDTPILDFANDYIQYNWYIQDMDDPDSIVDLEAIGKNLQRDIGLDPKYITSVEDVVDVLEPGNSASEINSYLLDYYIPEEYNESVWRSRYDVIYEALMPEGKPIYEIDEDYIAFEVQK